MLSGRGRTDVVRRRISQQHAKLCGVLQKNGRLGVFNSAGKEECLVPVQSVMSTGFVFFLDLSQSVMKASADDSIRPAATGFLPTDS